MDKITEILANGSSLVNDFLSCKVKDLPKGRLSDAMKYALLLGGKRIRPILVHQVGQMLGVEIKKLQASAAAIECIHTYSLIHDDLPAMDNDDLRRGQKTCHLAFDEAHAILAGDALQTLAFSFISEDFNLTDTEKVKQIQVLAKASGVFGMCLGQSLDLQGENQVLNLQQIETIHRLKTAELLKASVLLGFNLSIHCHDLYIKKQLENYAQSLGLAFQIKDDILNLTGDKNKIGKAVGSDLEKNKNTYPKILGLDGAEQMMQKTYNQALISLKELINLGFNTQVLQQIADFVIDRDK